jgi:hypothetical protein
LKSPTLSLKRYTILRFFCLQLKVSCHRFEKKGTYRQPSNNGDDGSDKVSKMKRIQNESETKMKR